MLFLGFIILAIVGIFIFFTIPEMWKDAKEWYKLYFAKSKFTPKDQQELQRLIDLRRANESVFNNTTNPKVLEIAIYRDIAFQREIDSLIRAKSADAVRQLKRMER